MYEKYFFLSNAIDMVSMSRLTMIIAVSSISWPIISSATPLFPLISAVDVGCATGVEREGVGYAAANANRTDLLILQAPTVALNFSA
jgi:hypothetical protein